MIRILMFLFLSISTAISCQQILEPETEISNNVPEVITGPLLNEIPFDIQFELNPIKGAEYELIIQMEIDPGSYIVSPFSKDSFLLQFYFEMNETPHLVMSDSLVEIPLTKEEYDPIFESYVRYAKGKTTYKYKFVLINDNDFETNGLIGFLVEPSCVPYVVDFTIKSNTGKLVIEKGEVGYAKGYVKK